MKKLKKSHLLDIIFRKKSFSFSTQWHNPVLPTCRGVSCASLGWWFNCVCTSDSQAWWQAGAADNWKCNKNIPLEILTWMKPGKCKFFGGKAKLAGRFLGHEVIICSAWRLFEARPMHTFWGSPITKPRLLLAPQILTQKMPQRQDFALSAQSS